MSKYSEYEYMYAASKISSLSVKLADKTTLFELCDSKNQNDLYDRLGEIGIQPIYVSGVIDDELSLSSFLSVCYSELQGFIPDEEPVTIMRLRYDCHNLKTGIKCRYLGISPDSFYIDCGNISCSSISTYCINHDFSAVPGKLGIAASIADKSIDASGDSRVLDINLDYACFFDMKTAADSFGFKPASELLSLKIDLTNLLIALRIQSMSNRNTAAVYSDKAFIDGGRIPISIYQDSKSYDELSKAISHFISEDFEFNIRKLLREGLETVSIYMDRFFLKKANDISSRSQLGAYPVLGYMISLESEIKNLRIIISGINSGIDSDSIRERLRL